MERGIGLRVVLFLVLSAAWDAHGGGGGPPDLWVDAAGGDDDHDGTTAETAFRTLGRAAGVAGPGTTVHVMPGVYRETLAPAADGEPGAPVVWVAEEGTGTATIRGSDRSSSLRWTQLAADTIGLPDGVDPTDVYYAELGSWNLDGPPRFVVELDGDGEVVARLPMAREPDWDVRTEWKYHELWWAADGGSRAAGCVPSPDAPDCDAPSRSTTQLTDRTDDDEPEGIEPGNLTTLGDLTGANLVAVDTQQGHYVFRRTIVAHDVPGGRITVDRICEHNSGGPPGLGWGTKYHVEGKASLLDEPGEWWYDEVSRRLYLWSPRGGDPADANIEISRRAVGVNLRGRSHVVLDGLVVELHEEDAIRQENGQNDSSYDNVVRGAVLRWASRGISLLQTTLGTGMTDGFTLERSEVAHMDTTSIRTYQWWGSQDADAFTYPGLVDVVIRDSEIHHIGFRSDMDSANGTLFYYPDRMTFEGNHVHHIAHNGTWFAQSVIQSPDEWGFSPEEILTGEILIKDNVFERACQVTADCGALKIWGRFPDGHVFRDLLVTGNVLRDTYGWTYISEKRGRRWTGAGSQRRGMGGFGLYFDHASGIHAYRNVSYNAAYIAFLAYAEWRDGDIVYYDNVAADSVIGFALAGRGFDTHPSVRTLVSNNVIVGNEGRGVWLDDEDDLHENVVFDHNLYHENGWRSFEDGGLWNPGAMLIAMPGASSEYHATLADIQEGTDWEDHGLAGDPRFADYDVSDHEMFDGSWPDFHLTAESDLAIDRGTDELPESLQALLSHFGVSDPRAGTAWDIGAHEWGTEEEEDAGPDASADAATGDAGDAGDAGPTRGRRDGCGCRAGGPRAVALPGLLAALVAFVSRRKHVGARSEAPRA